MRLRCNKDVQGRFLTFALFFETKTEGYLPTFTYKEEDHEYKGVHYISMRKLYLEMEDPTEYLFATEVLGSWDHWLKLCKSKTILEHIKHWREELAVKLKAQAIQAMITTAKVDGSKGTTAAKWLASAGWEEGKGRPSKAKLAGEIKKATQAASTVDGDMVRLGLVKK